MKFAILILLCALPTPLARAADLPLDAYLDQVRARNAGVRAAAESAAAGRERSREGALVTAPQISLSAQKQADGKLSSFPGLNYTSLDTTSVAAVLTQPTRFGLTARLGVQAVQTEYVGLSPAFSDGRPYVELSQSLWSNGFGRGTRATEELAEAQALASSYGASFQGRATLAEAEAAYWRLVGARSAVEAQRRALEQARKLKAWADRRARLRLADDSDALQADAALKVRTLEHQAALDESRAAARAFNALRNEASEEVGESLADRLPELGDAREAAATPAAGGAIRDDLRAAEQASRAAGAAAQLGQEKHRPTLEVYGGYGVNGRDPSLPSSVTQSFSQNRATWSVGARFAMPLTLGSLGEARSGHAREQLAADLDLQRKRFEQDQAWRDLHARLGDVERRARMAAELESANERKVVHERRRLESGRTTTYQVLLFEQEFAQSQVARIRAQTEFLGTRAQLSLWSAE